jgi:phospholipid N-methyltransferase
MDFLRKFGQMWRGGYFEGSPLDPMGSSSYGIYGYNSVLYTIYLACIRPYITPETVVLEIGPGRGAWSKTILERNCRKLYAVDAAEPAHTRFWEYIGKDSRAEYIVVDDFSLAQIPDDSIDYFFSFGVFCHLKPEMCEEYVQSLAGKMRHGSRGFLMVADFDKFDRCLADAGRLSIGRFFAEQRRGVWIPAKVGYFLAWRFFRSKMDMVSTAQLKDNVEYYQWYHWGIERACKALTRAGFDIVETDAQVCPRDPVIHFKKP